MFICSQTGRLTASQSRIHSCKTRHTGLQHSTTQVCMGSNKSLVEFFAEKPLLASRKCRLFTQAYSYKQYLNYLSVVFSILKIALFVLY